MTSFVSVVLQHQYFPYNLIAIFSHATHHNIVFYVLLTISGLIILRFTHFIHACQLKYPAMLSLWFLFVSYTITSLQISCLFTQLTHSVNLFFLSTCTFNSCACTSLTHTFRWHIFFDHHYHAHYPLISYFYLYIFMLHLVLSSYIFVPRWFLYF